MAWLKYELSHAWGYSSPEYIELGERDDLENVKAEINAEYGDGLRYPRFEVIEELPTEVLEAKIKSAEAAARSWTAEAAHLRSMRKT